VAQKRKNAEMSRPTHVTKTSLLLVVDIYDGMDLPEPPPSATCGRFQPRRQLPPFCLARIKPRTEIIDHVAQNRVLPFQEGDCGCWRL
jgi:hypothetical protein